MNIIKFKLLDGGLSGVRIDAVEKMPHENMMFLDDVQRTRKIPLGDELREKIQNLKYFFLNLTSHWISPFNKYFDLQEYKLLPLIEINDQQPQGQTLLHDIWNHTKITGVTIKNGGFVITGTIEVVDMKKIGISTPFITEEDDLSFYLDARKHIEDIMEELGNTIEMRMLPIPTSKQMLLSFGEKEEEVSDLNLEELEKKFYNRLVDRGAIIIIDDNYFNDPGKIGNGPSEAILNTNTNSIDSHNMPEAEIHEDKHQEVLDEYSKKQKKENNKKDSTLVSDAKFNVNLDGEIPRKTGFTGKDPDDIIPGGSLEELEYSQNMGLSDQVREQVEEHTNFLNDDRKENPGNAGEDQNEDMNDKSEW